MRLLKTIVFFVVFFITLVQAMGNPLLRFEQNSFVIEHQEKKQPATESISMEFDEPQDECSVVWFFPCTCISVIKKNVNQIELHFDISYYHTFWQPPRKS